MTAAAWVKGLWDSFWEYAEGAAPDGRRLAGMSVLFSCAVIALLTCVTSLLGPPHLLPREFASVFILEAASVLLLGGVWFAHRAGYDIRVPFTLVHSAIMVAAAVVVGPDLPIEFFILPQFITAFILWERREKSGRAFGLLIPFVTIAALESSPLVVPSPILASGLIPGLDTLLILTAVACTFWLLALHAKSQRAGVQRLHAAERDLSSELARGRLLQAHEARSESHRVASETSLRLVDALRDPLNGAVAGVEALRLLTERVLATSAPSVSADDLEAIDDTMASIVRMQRLRAILQQLATQECPVGLSSVNEAVALGLQASADRLPKRTWVEFDCETDSLILMNSAAVARAVAELIENACAALEAIPADRRRLRLEAKPTDSGACIEVEDSGGGIPESVQGRMFEPFYTAGPVGRSTGLGLNLVYETARSHGGRVDYTTGPSGTCFTMCLSGHTVRFDPLPHGQAPSHGLVIPESDP